MKGVRGKVLAPLAILWFNGSDWTFPGKGILWSCVAGILGALGAFCVLLAFGAKGSPSVVMAIVFAGAPLVNATVALSMHPPKGGWGVIPLPFWLGILLAASGGFLVSKFKPGPGPPPAAKPPAAETAAE